MKTKKSCDTGLIAWLENSRISLPLKGVEARFDVRGDLVSVRLRQVYFQSHSAPLQVRYSFPLPGGASVYQCTVLVNDRVISAKVLPLEEARKQAAEKKAAGHRTALVESVRDNLFELELGNLAPGDTVVVELEWFQIMESSGQERCFRIPFTPGVRYIPGAPLLRQNSGRGTEDDTSAVPDASRLSPPRVDAFHPDAAWASVEGCIAADGSQVDAASPSHTLVLREGTEGVNIRLGDRSAVPDRDFILRIQPRAGESLTQRAWLSQDQDKAHALVRICAPAKCPARVTATDVYFLVDRSGSMEGDKWTACCRAFRRFLGVLPAHDRAWVTFFESSYLDLAEKPLPPSAILNEPSVQSLESLGVAGGTELLPALEHVLSAIARCSQGRRAVIVLITDGQVGNESEVLALMQQQHPALPVYCFGIDHAVNDAFLRSLAANQRGACTLVTPREDLEGAIERLAARLLHPVLTGIQPPAGWELPAGAIPDLHAGEMLAISLRGTGAPAALAFTADAGEKAERITLTISVQQVADKAPAMLWARERITLLEASGQFDEAAKLSVESGIISQRTAFFAWDEAERMAIPEPLQEIYQPSQMVPGKDTLKRMRGVTLVMSKDLGRPPTNEELSEETGIERAKLRSKLSQPSLETLDQTIHEDYAGLPSKICSKLSEWDEEESNQPQPATPPPHAAPAPARKFLKQTGSLPLQSILAGAKAGETLPAGKAILFNPGASEWRMMLEPLTGAGITSLLLDWLEQWSLSDPALTALRQKALEELAARLITAKAPADFLTNWLEQNLEPAFLAAMRHALAAAG